jgi:hypothetical protein
VPPVAGQDKRQDKPKSRPKYIRWSDLLRRVFGIETICSTCQTPLRLISLIKSETIARRILTAMHLPADAPTLQPARPPAEAARPPPRHDGEECQGADWVS